MNDNSLSLNADERDDHKTVNNAYQPFLLGKKFQIVPPGHSQETESRISIVMNRGAFGSGEHETTRSCIEILEQLPIHPALKALDFGCGTGILSIAAIKMGISEVWCLDIAEQAITSCQKNCILNNITEKTSHFCGTLELFKEESFDLLLANIYGDILLSQADSLVSKLNKNARLILSGILWEDNFSLRKRYESLGCRIVKNYLLEEYSTILLQME